MTYTTVKRRADVTYTEVSPMTPAGSASSSFHQWVVDSTEANEAAATAARIAEQFKNMTTGGRSYVITAQTVVATRPYRPPTP